MSDSSGGRLRWIKAAPGAVWRTRAMMSVPVASLLAALLAGALAFKPFAFAGEAKKALSVAIFVSSDADRCYSPATVKAIKHFTAERANEINAEGGVGGRLIKLRFFDDYDTAANTVANVRDALEDRSMVAMIGVYSSTRGRAVFDKLGPKIRDTALPFITEMSLDRIFRDYPNVFTMASSVRNELEVVRKMIADGGFKRPVFVGVDNDLYSFALGDGVRSIPGSPALVGDFQLPVRSYRIDPKASAPTALKIAGLNPDLIILSLYSTPSAVLLRQLGEAGIKAPVFVLLGRISTISRKLGKAGYGGSLSQIAREGVPNVYSERLRQRIWRSPQNKWVFDDTPDKAAPGWKDGSCTLPDARPKRQIYDADNRRAIGRGTQYRDMLELIVQAARTAPGGLSTDQLRRHIGSRLRAFVEGRHVLKGLWRDWAFTASRTAAKDTLFLTKAPGDEANVLYPVQYRRISGTLHAAPTVYTSIDLIKLSRIDTNDKSFDAEFYLSMKSADNRLTVEDIEFTNAYRSQAGAGKLLSIRKIHGGQGDSDFPKGVRLYKVSGKFTFEPELGQYPFDTQRLSVSFQPASTAQSFLIQPPARRQRQADIAVDGWNLSEQYVGADQDIIPTIGASLAERRVVPFYKFNATWVVERIATDYYLRVVVPLCFILLVTYFSVFLPHQRFESLMGIQVTALLSSIALYLALPKVDTDQATLSDKIFMMTYAAVSVMIGLSILKDNIWREEGGVLIWLVAGVQRIVFPLAVIALITIMVSSTGGQAASITGRLVAIWQSLLG